MGWRAVAPVQVAVAAASLLLAPLARSAPPERCPDADLRPAASNLELVETAMVCVLNAERKRAGRTPVRRRHKLDRSARRHTRDMVGRGYFAHERPKGPSVLERIRRTRYFRGARSGLYSENLGFAPPERASAASMTGAFAASDSHRKTMLHGRFRDVGVAAVYQDPDPAFYPDWPAVVFTLDFGRRYERHRRCRGSASGDSRVDSGGRSTRPRQWCGQRRPR